MIYKEMEIRSNKGVLNLEGYEILIPLMQPAVYTARKLIALAIEHPDLVAIDLPEIDQDKIRSLSDSIEVVGDEYNKGR